MTDYADRGDWRNAAHSYRDQRDVLAARLAELEAAVDAVRALCDERDRLTYSDTPHPGYVDTDEIRAALTQADARDGDR